MLAQNLSRCSRLAKISDLLFLTSPCIKQSFSSVHKLQCLQPDVYAGARFMMDYHIVKSLFFLSFHAHAMTLARKMADAIHCRTPASYCLSMSFLFYNLCHFKCNLHILQGKLKRKGRGQVEGTKAMT